MYPTVHKHRQLSDNNTLIMEIFTSSLECKKRDNIVRFEEIFLIHNLSTVAFFFVFMLFWKKSIFKEVKEGKVSSSTSFVCEYF